MKVLLINGSPHEKGCTYTALREAADAMEACGVETEILWVGKVPTRGCIACGGCNNAGKCVFDDDMVNRVGELAQTADGFVFGSPVYYAGLNGTLSSLMDRLFYSQGRYFRHKPAAAVVSARRAGTTTALDEIQKYFGLCEMPLVNSSYWAMVHGSKAEDARQDEEGMQVMRNLGRNMAWLLGCIEAGREKGITPKDNEYGVRTNFIR